MKRVLIGAMLLGLTAVAPSAHADAALRGSAVGSSGTRYGCEGASCTTFRASGCPEELARAHGGTTSIVDVRSYAGETLTFSWSDAGMKAYDASPPLYQLPVSQLMFYAIRSCEPYAATHYPNALPVAFTLTTRPEHRTATYTIPPDATWLVAEPMHHSADVEWWAYPTPEQ